MACNADFVQFIVDQCSGAGDITVRKMMGDYCIYCNGVLFGLICDNNFYVWGTIASTATESCSVSSATIISMSR